MITLRPYQTNAVDAQIEFFKRPKNNGISIIPTGAGKSIIIAETVRQLGEPTLILQPSKEILEQNIAKYRSYGNEATIYSASLKSKVVGDVTYATIGSIVNKPELFKHFKHLIVDEAHTVNSKQGMYSDFLKAIGETKVLGLTATPYRLTAGMEGSMLKFLTRTRPRVFQDVIYTIQTKELFDAGYLCPVTYHDIKGFDRKKVRSNSTGADFDEKSLSDYYDEIQFGQRLVQVLTRLHQIRKATVVFTRFVKEAEFLKSKVEGVEVVTAETPAKLRTELITKWRLGEIKTLANVGILSVGVDFPELDTVVLARPTKSLALYYQQAGRGIRIHHNKKDTWLVDMTDNTPYFGKLEDLHVGTNEKGLWQVSSNDKPLTNVIL